MTHCNSYSGHDARNCFLELRGKQNVQDISNFLILDARIWDRVHRVFSTTRIDRLVFRYVTKLSEPINDRSPDSRCGGLGYQYIYYSMLGQSDSLSISLKLCRYKISIKFVTIIHNFHALRNTNYYILQFRPIKMMNYSVLLPLTRECAFR